MSQRLRKSERALVAWLSACAAACSLDVSPRRGLTQSRADAGAGWSPSTKPSDISPVQSRAAPGNSERTDALLDSDAGALDDAAVRVLVDAATRSVQDAMPAGPAPVCQPDTLQCQGNSVLACSVDGVWSDSLPCSASQQCSDGLCTELPSCTDRGRGVSDCGSGTQSCCDSPLVPGGSYSRTYTSTAAGQATQLGAPAMVSAFRLDKYEVTVGRFRRFVTAWSGGTGYSPLLAAGKHEHLHEGRGLRVLDGAYEPGWTDADSRSVEPTDINLRCDLSATWTAAPAEAERLPMTCVNWAEAKAFCIWDGGFLPSEAEWEFAAAGGDEQRKYPWGATAPGVANQFAIYGCLYPSGPVVPGGSTGVCNGDNVSPVGTATLGNALWGQLDLGGNVWEWTLDSSTTDAVEERYLALCTDCVDSTPATQRLVRGGQYENSDFTLQPTFRKLANANDRYPGVGFRCARKP